MLYNTSCWKWFHSETNYQPSKGLSTITVYVWRGWEKPVSFVILSWITDRPLNQKSNISEVQKTSSYNLKHETIRDLYIVSFKTHVYPVPSLKPGDVVCLYCKVKTCWHDQLVQDQNRKPHSVLHIFLHNIFENICIKLCSSYYLQ